MNELQIEVIMPEPLQVEVEIGSTVKFETNQEEVSESLPSLVAFWLENGVN